MPQAAMDHMLRAAYADLRSLAASYLHREQRRTIQPTELVHEAYLRVAELRSVEWRGRTHLFAATARQMRRVLVDRARASAALKRGRMHQRVSVNGGHLAAPAQDASLNVMAVHEALEQLSKRHPRQAKIAEMRLFLGLSIDHIAQVVQVTPRTVAQDWRVAKAWIGRRVRPAHTRCG